MRHAYIVSPSDLSDLKRIVFDKLRIEPMVCSSLKEISKLQQADVIYFVASQTSMCSTAYQELVMKAFAATAERSSRSLLKLDKVNIPLGFSMLRTLPESIFEET